MKKLGLLLLGLVTITLFSACGNSESKKTLTCKNSQEESGVLTEQVISMTFTNDKIGRVKMDVNTKITDEDVKENWSMFTSIMDSQTEEINKDGVVLKKSKDDKNYEYKITLDIDLNKANKDVLSTYDLDELKDLVDEKNKLEDVKKLAESDGFTCKVE